MEDSDFTSDDEEEKPLIEEINKEIAGEKEKEEKDQEKTRTVPYDRFNDVLNERNTLRREKREREEQEKKRREKELEKNEEFKTLAEDREKEVATLKEQIGNLNKSRAIESAAAKLSVRDIDVVTKLIDLGKIKVDDNGEVTNAEEVVKELVEQKPYLVDADGGKNIGSGGGSPSGDGEKGKGKIWKASELKEKMRNHEWYEEHKKEIDAAEAEGRIREDE